MSTMRATHALIMVVFVIAASALTALWPLPGLQLVALTQVWKKPLRTQTPTVALSARIPHRFLLGSRGSPHVMESERVKERVGLEEKVETDAMHDQPGRQRYDQTASITSTADLDASSRARRRSIFVGSMLATVTVIGLGGLAIFLKKSGKLDRCSKVTVRDKIRGKVGKVEGAHKYDALHTGESDQGQGGVGLGELSEDELREICGTDRDLSPAERARKLAEWVQADAERSRAQNEAFLRLRFAILIFLFGVYVAACLALPLIHTSEATCSHGFFWETHMQFLAVLSVNKLAELWLCAMDPMIGTWDLSFFEFVMKFAPSFLGYLDGYTDSTAIVIAHSCPDPFAQRLVVWMSIAYVVGVVIMQWVVCFAMAVKDPSHSCLMKLLHMDLYASFVTLPPSFKRNWDLISLVRTFGEDLEQAVFQSLYLIYVKKNIFMLISVAVGVLTSLKALRDAYFRALEARGAAEQYENRKRDYTIYSCSQDMDIRCWDVTTGTCTKVLTEGNPVNSIVATQGKLYSSHDDGRIREWSLESGQVTRQFEHPGMNGIVIATATHLYSWTASEEKFKQWSLATGQCTREFSGPKGKGEAFASMFAKGDRFFGTSPIDDNDIFEWSIDSEQHLQTYKGHTAALKALFVTSKRLFSGAADHTIKEWSRETGACTRTFSDFVGKSAKLLVVEGILYAPGRQPVINEWSLATGDLVRTFVGHSDSVRGLVVVKNNLYSCSNDATIKEWSLSTGSELSTYTSHTERIFQLAVQFKED